MAVRTLKHRHGNNLGTEEELMEEIKGIFGGKLPDKYVRYIRDKMEKE